MNNLKLNCNPIAKAENIVAGAKYRITMLTSALLRLEYSEDGEFVDNATQTILNRDFDKVSYKLTEN